MANPRQRRAMRRKGRTMDVKLNITSMMDMFTIILVFLLKSYSAEGQLVTPADGLLLPNSSAQKSAERGLEIKVSQAAILVEDRLVVGGKDMQEVMAQKDYLIQPLRDVLLKYSREARSAARSYAQDFKGSVVLQGDKEIPYNLLVKLMYTCGQAGFPSINMIVYKGE